MNPSDPVLLYTTFPTPDDARRVGSLLVEEKLAACVNIFPGMVSIYRWNDTIETGAEVAMLVKTVRHRVDTARERLVAEHPWQIPCVIELPVADGHPPWLAWLVTSTTAGEAD